MIDAIKWVFAAVPDSIKGKINGKELIKVVLGAALAFLGGTGVGGISAAIDHLQGNLSSVAPDVLNAGSTAAIVTLIFEFIRRKYVNGTVQPKPKRKTKTK